MKKVRYGVIGIKGIGSVHLDAAQRIPNLELTAVADVDGPFVEKKAMELGVRAFTDYRAMLDKDIVDAVSIATPNHLHGEMGLESLRAGVHIFMEKPFSVRVSEANAMLEISQAKRLKISVGHQYRTYRFARKLKSVIDSGVLGRILRVLWTWIEFRPECYYHRDPWRATWRTAGGGVLMSHAIHHLDLMCWLIGKPIQVSAIMGNQLRTRQIEDIACANILFERGAFATFQATINQPKTNNVCQIAGEKGLIIVPELRSLTDDEDEPILYGSYPGDIGSLDQQMTGTWDQPPIEWRWLNSERNGLNGAFHRLLQRDP
ncbi:MAG TPA: Gfo/Idh/MocA family oxidoreductase, partial [Acidobacteriota bacterium]|nr:Gfo/Idh/MocA family oxidoreductase [Acidobacteriota bacterium]